MEKAVNAKGELHQLCQFNLTGQKDHELTKTDFVYAPWVNRYNAKPTYNGNKKAMLAVDMFTGDIQAYSMRDRTAKSLIKAMDESIVQLWQ